MVSSRDSCWVCDQCGKAFQSRLNRTLHRHTHSVYRPYICKHKLCNQTFSQLSQLQRHRQAHIDHRKYRCGICKTRFLYLHHLKLHRCRIKDAKIHSCHFCSSRFLQILALAHHLKTKHSKLMMYSKLKWVGKTKQLKQKKNRKSKRKEKAVLESGKEKILLKIALGKSMTIISSNKTPSDLNKTRRSKRKSNKKEKQSRKKLQKNGIILSFRNGSVSSVPLDSENIKNENTSRKLKPFKINGLLKKVVDEPKIPKLRIKACPQTEISRSESTEDEDVPELYSRTDSSFSDLDNLRKHKNSDNNNDSCEAFTNISKLPENTLSKFPPDAKIRSGIIIHKNKGGRYSSAEQIQTTKSRKFDSLDSASVGFWEVMPSPRTDSPSDFLKLRFSPKKAVKLDSGLDNTFDGANSKYLDVSFKAKSVDSCAEDSDVFETSPCADKDLVEANSVNDSGIEVLSSSSCNRSNGNSVRSVILDENSPTYCLTEDSLISLDSPVVEAVSKAEHSICMKCGGIIMENNNNTRSPSKCQCSFISAYLTSPSKNMAASLDDGYTEMEADNTLKEEYLDGPSGTYFSSLHISTSEKIGNKMNTQFPPTPICNFTPVEVTKVETSETSPLKMKFRFEREPCVDIQKSETIVCAVTEEKKTTEEKRTIHKRKPLFRSDSKTNTCKQLDTEIMKTDSPSESTSTIVEKPVSTKKPLFKPLKKKEPENVNDDVPVLELVNNNERAEVCFPSNEAVIIIDDENIDVSTCATVTANKCSDSKPPSKERDGKRDKHSEKSEKELTVENNKNEQDISSHISNGKVVECKLECITTVSANMSLDGNGVSCSNITTHGNEETVTNSDSEVSVPSFPLENCVNLTISSEVSIMLPLESDTMPILKSPVKSPLNALSIIASKAPEKSLFTSLLESPAVSLSISPINSPPTSALKSPFDFISMSPQSPSRLPMKSPSRSPVKSPSQSEIKSPSNSQMKSPSKSPMKSPCRSPVKSPSKSPFIQSLSMSPSKTSLKSTPISPEKLPSHSPAITPFESHSKSQTVSLSKTPATPSSLSPSKASPTSTSKPPQSTFQTSPSRSLSKSASNVLVKSPSSGNSPSKSRKNIFSTIASDFENSTHVSLGDSFVHSTNIATTERPVTTDNEVDMCKNSDMSCVPEIDSAIVVLNEVPVKFKAKTTVETPAKSDRTVVSNTSATSDKMFDSDKFAKKPNTNIAENISSVDNNLNVSDLERTHEDASYSNHSVFASQPATVVNGSCIEHFDADNLQLIPQSPKKSELNTIISPFDESEEDSFQQLPTVVSKLQPTSSPKTSLITSKKVKSPLDLFQQQFLSFLSHKDESKETKDLNSKCKAAASASDFGNANGDTHVDNKKVKPPAKRKSLSKSNQSNKVKATEKSEKTCDVKANNPMFDDDLESELGTMDQKTENYSPALDWLKCTFDSNETRKGSPSPELDLSIIVSCEIVNAKKSRDRLNSSESKLKLKKKPERSKFGELHVNSILANARKKKTKGSRGGETCKKQTQENSIEINENSIANDSDISIGEKTNCQKAKKSDGGNNAGIKLSQNKKFTIETDSESSNSSSVVHCVSEAKHCKRPDTDGANDMSRSASVDNDNAGTCQYLDDSDPDYNPFQDLNDDFQFKPKLGPNRSYNRQLKRRHTTDNTGNLNNDEDSQPFESKSLRTVGESDHDADAQNRGRRTMQGRKSCCPCCLGTSLPNKREEHGDHTHPKHMYKLPKNYKQFIKSSTRLLALQERIHNLFITLFPDCSDLISNSQVGTEDFELLIDEVISGLDAKDIEFESSSTNNLFSNSVTDIQSHYTEATPLSFVPVETDLLGVQEELNIESELSDVSKTVQYLVDEVVIKCDRNPVEMSKCAGIRNSNVETPCKSYPDSETIGNCCSEIEINSHGDSVKYKRVCCMKFASTASESNNKLDYVSPSNLLEKLNYSGEFDNTNLHLNMSAMPDKSIPGAVSASRNESDCPTIPVTHGCSTVVDGKTQLLPLSDKPAGDNTILMDTCNVNDDNPVDFEMATEVPLIRAIPTVQNELVITIDLNAARVSLCKDPNDCLQLLHSKVVKLVTSLLPDLKLKNSVLKHQDNLEFLLDLITKSNDGPIPDDPDEELEKSSANISEPSAVPATYSESICVEVARPDTQMNFVASDKIEKPDKCGNLITNFLAKCEKLEAEKSESSAKNEVKTHSENTVEERMPLFSKCQEMFVNEIKLRKESLKKDIFEFEEDPDAVLGDPKGADRVLRSFRRLTRKKKVNIAKKYRKIAKREDKKKKAKRLTTSPNVENESIHEISDTLANTKKRFLSELSLGDKNGKPTTASTEPVISASQSSKETSPVKVDESSELPSPDCKRHGDKNIFELLQPSHKEPSSSL